jgi:hypothetical protein
MPVTCKQIWDGIEQQTGHDLIISNTVITKVRTLHNSITVTHIFGGIANLAFKLSRIANLALKLSRVRNRMLVTIRGEGVN